MAVFVAATDESAGRDHRSTFIRGGFVAPERDWSECFAPAWEERVLNRTPAIPYLHMTEIRSPSWRASHGLTAYEADSRVESAFDVIHSMGSLYPVTSQVDAGFLNDSVSRLRFPRDSSGIKKPLDPEFICFIAFAYTVFAYLDFAHPDAEKVDFVIESNDRMTQRIGVFHELMKPTLERSGHESWARLVGDLIPGGKERVPLQAADVLCWHAQRREAGTLDRWDSRRYAKLAHRKGTRHIWTREHTIEFAQSAVADGVATELGGSSSVA